MGYESERLMKYLPWAQHFARSCTTKLPNHLDRDDLQSAGVLGYLRAASRYDAALGASFQGYCALRIRGAVLDELRRWDWVPRSVYKNQRRITHITQNLTASLEREPTQMELAEALGMEETELTAYQMQSQPYQVVSLDEVPENPYGEEGLSLRERLPDSAVACPDAGMISAENRRTMLKCLAALPKVQVTVIVLHYLQNVPLRQVATILGVTPARVSQLHYQALGRLKCLYQRAHAPPPGGY